MNGDIEEVGVVTTLLAPSGGDPSKNVMVVGAGARPTRPTQNMRLHEPPALSGPTHLKKLLNKNAPASGAKRSRAQPTYYTSNSKSAASLLAKVDARDLRAMGTKSKMNDNWTAYRDKPDRMLPDIKSLE